MAIDGNDGIVLRWHKALFQWVWSQFCYINNQSRCYDSRWLWLKFRYKYKKSFFSEQLTACCTNNNINERCLLPGICANRSQSLYQDERERETWNKDRKRPALGTPFFSTTNLITISSKGKSDPPTNNCSHYCIVKKVRGRRSGKNTGIKRQVGKQKNVQRMRDKCKGKVTKRFFSLLVMQFTKECSRHLLSRFSKGSPSWKKFLSSFVSSFSRLLRTQIVPFHDIDHGPDWCQFLTKGVRAMVNIKWWY